MILLDYHNKEPIYEQIKQQIMLLIRQGELKTNEKLPSIRSLSSELNLNVNTVNRAFNELERMGVIYSIPGKGNFVGEMEPDNPALKKKALDDVRLAINTAYGRGITSDELMDIIERQYGGENEDIRD